MSQRLQQDRDQQEIAERARLAEQERSERAQLSEAEQARAATVEARENRVAIAVLLLVLSLVALGAAGIMMVKDRTRQAGVLAGVGGALLIAAVAVFFTRPGFDDIGDAKAEGAVTDPPQGALAGRNACRLVPDRSRVTVSATQNVDLDWSETGCVNRRTQYARSGAAWTRILVPNQDQSVAVIEVRPARREYVVNRYLLSAEAMGRARQLRQKVSLASCTSNPEELQRLSQGQEQIRAMLPELPNEHLVYECSAARG
jgi:hypothetical protein